ncbi:MAG: ribosome hibernation-promoting factor, HPF/YfiA family [Candidatus Cloacimonadia bacterium]
MQIIITARHFDLTDTIKDYVEQSVKKLTRYFEPIMKANVVLSIEGNRKFAELSIKAKNFNFISKAEDNKDMYIAIDSAVEKVEGQIKKQIGKLQDRGIRRTKGAVQPAQETPPPPPDITHKKVIPIILSVDQAVAELQNNNDNYLLFRNIQDKKLNLIRKTGDNSFDLLALE